MLELVLRSADSPMWWNTLVALTICVGFCSLVFVVGVMSEKRKG